MGKCIIGSAAILAALGLFGFVLAKPSTETLPVVIALLTILVAVITVRQIQMRKESNKR